MSTVHLKYPYENITINQNDTVPITTTTPTWIWDNGTLVPASPVPTPSIPATGTYTFSPAEPEEDEEPPIQLTVPKCYGCGKEAEAVVTYRTDAYLVAIIKCHGAERRVDIALKRFKGNIEDAIEWFSENFQWAFEEEEKWRKVEPDPDVSTVRADKKIISEWLDNI